MALLVMGSSMAQIPNAGFELWSNQGGYTDPDGWITYNDVMTPQGYFTTVEPGTPGAVGVFYALVQSRALSSGGTIQGWMSAAPAGHGGPAGFACSTRPAELTGQWQYGIQPNDTAVVMVMLTRSGSGGELIATGQLEVTGEANSWTTFTVPLNYLSNDIPDTAYIQFAASKSFASPIAGSFLKVDALLFAGIAGIAEPGAMHGLHVYPSPATGMLHIRADASMHQVEVLDLTGRSLMERPAGTGLEVLDVSSLRTGHYLVRISWGDGSKSATGFSKE